LIRGCLHLDKRPDDSADCYNRPFQAFHKMLERPAPTVDDGLPFLSV